MILICILSNSVFLRLGASTAAWSSNFDMALKPWFFKGNNWNFDKAKLQVYAWWLLLMGNWFCFCSVAYFTRCRLVLSASTAAWSSDFDMVLKPWSFKGNNWNFDKAKLQVFLVLFAIKMKYTIACALLQKHHKNVQFYFHFICDSV